MSSPATPSWRNRPSHSRQYDTALHAAPRLHGGTRSPRAVVHKRILDVAASSPDASMEAIADEVPGATTDLVERVFEEYGDPASEATSADETAVAPTTDQTETTTMQENGDHATGEATAAGIEPSSLTERQRETLRLVHDNPGWTQADVADKLGVSRATVSRRLNDIPGFEWTDRGSFTGRVFGDAPGTDGEADSPDADAGAVAANGGAAPVTDSEETASGSEAPAGQPVSLPPELARRVVHACMHSDRITEDEELRLIEALLEN